jgi:hypothetical protein
MSNIEKQVEGLRYAPQEIQQKGRAIYEATLRESSYIQSTNFGAIAPADVERLFRLYDEQFFGGLFQRLLDRPGEGVLTFRVSKTMTRAGGKTTCVRRRDRSKGETGPVIRYELAVSAPLLFQTFRTEERSVTVAGIRCVDRLEALQRIIEHEMIHLLELLVWRESNCDRERFQRMANNLFGHTASRHELVTQSEVAYLHLGIMVGDRVSFQHDGTRYTGIVNRITKRATVLVEHPRGMPYSDGNRYRAIYVPLEMLEPAAA